MKRLKDIEKEMKKMFEEEKRNIKTIGKLELINNNLKRKRKELLKTYLREFIKIRKRRKEI